MIKKIKNCINDSIYLLSISLRMLLNKDSLLIYIGSPEYYNTGDIAIMYGTRLYFDKYFPNYKVIDITLEIYMRFSLILRYLIRPHDYIFITGGGFIGNVWKEGNNVVQEVLVRHKENKIVILPQSVQYVGSTKQDDFMRDKLIYEDHKNILMILREDISYNFVKMNFEFKEKSKAIKSIDMAFMIDYSSKKQTNQAALVCLREDKEKTILLNDDQLRILINKFKLNKFIKTDTAFNKRIERSNRIKALYNKLDEFDNSELIITDRLHGMIFAILLNKPCVIIDSMSHKLFGVYKLFRDNENINFVKNLNKLNKLTINVSSKRDRKQEISTKFDELNLEIKSFLNISHVYK